MRRYQVARTVSIFIVSIALLILLTVVLLISPSARAHASTPLNVPATGTVSVQITPTIQATPTVDATMTTLEKERLMEQDNWLWNNLDPLLAPIIPAAAVVLGIIVGLQRFYKEQSIDRDKRDEDRFQFAVRELGGTDPGQKVGGAVMLRTFLSEGYEKDYIQIVNRRIPIQRQRTPSKSYEKYYIQIFDLAVANLRVPRKSDSEKKPVINNPDNSESPDSLGQALSVLFRKAFPLARSECINNKEDKQQPQQEGPPNQALTSADENSPSVSEQYAEERSQKRLENFEPTLLDATGVYLENTYLNEADLSMAYLKDAHLKGAHLEGADLKGAHLEGADLEGAHLKGAQLKGAHLKGAQLKSAHLEGADLEGADLRNATYKVENLIKARLTKVILSDAESVKDLQNQVFEIDGENIDLTEIKLEKANLRNARFFRAILIRANLQGADLKETTFQDCDITDADLRDAKNLDLDKLKGVKGFSEARLGRSTA